MMKNILIVDDSALMRSVLRDIISSDDRFSCKDYARNGEDALGLLERHEYDAIVLDINMPKMNGLEFLQELSQRGRKEKVIVASSDTADGTDITIRALELGAFDFIQKPKNTVDSKGCTFRNRLLEMLALATDSEPRSAQNRKVKIDKEFVNTISEMVSSIKSSQPEIPPGTVQDVHGTGGKRRTDKGRVLVALACSTGGPKALQQVIPYLPKNLDAPVLIVQHMPVGFTKSLAERLNQISEISVKEAEEGDILKKGVVYIAKGGMHMKYKDTPTGGRIYYSDEPPREGVKPAANYMYESLMDCEYYDTILCVVLTGMGMDGTKGILNLSEKKKIHIIAQDAATCTVYGMPKAIAATGKVNQVVALQNVAQEITMNVGVN